MASHNERLLQQPHRGCGRGGRGSRGTGRGRGYGLTPAGGREGRSLGSNASLAGITPDVLRTTSTTPHRPDIPDHSHSASNGTASPPARTHLNRANSATANVQAIDWSTTMVTKDNYKLVPLYDPRFGPPNQAQRDAGFMAMLAGEPGLGDLMLRRAHSEQEPQKKTTHRSGRAIGKLIDINGDETEPQASPSTDPDAFELLPACLQQAGAGVTILDLWTRSRSRE